MKQFAFLSFLALQFCTAHAQAQTAFESAQFYAQSPSNVRNGIVILLSAPDPNIGQGIYLRRCNKANVTNAQSDIVYHYYTTTEPAFQGISGIAIDQSLFATASPQLDAQQWLMNVRIYKIASMDNIAVHQIPLEEKTKPAEMRYSKRLNQLFLAQYHNYTTQYNTDCDVVCFDLSQSSPYLAPILYHPSPSRYSTFTSIDQMNETALIVGSHFDAAWWYKDFAIPQGSASCYKVFNVPVKLPGPLVKNTYIDPMDTVLMSPKLDSKNLIRLTSALTINCIY